MNFKEIRIPVPWGYVAGKSWGCENEKPIVTFHGYQDNANSFDNLIKFLPNSYNYLCFDLPGHGKSSQFETKTMPVSFDFVLTIKLILDYLKKDKYIIIGHSFGGQISLYFTQMYPERVEKLICIDSVFFIQDEFMFIPTLKSLFTRYLKLHNLENDTAPSYTIEEAVQRMRESRIVPISEKSAMALIQRSLIPVGNNKYKISTAQQLKYVIRPPFSIDYITKLIKNFPVKCPHLLIKASESKSFYEVVHEQEKALKNSNRLFEAYIVDGNHNVHIEKPEIVARYIIKFLSRESSKL